jgi:hypothetical protein
MLVQAGELRAAAHLVQVVLQVEVLVARARAVQVDRDVVPVARRAAHRRELARLVPQARHLGVDLLVGDRDGRDGHHEALVSGDGHRGPHFHQCVEGDGAAVFARCDVDVGWGDRIDLGVCDRLCVQIRKRVVDGLLP